MNNDHYVYALIDKNFVIRYFGEGRGGRIGVVASRPKSYRDIFKDGGDVIVLYDNLSKLEARTKELELINKYSGNWNKNFNLINKSNPSVIVRDLSFEEADKYFELSASSPSGVVWKQKVAKLVVVGKQAGSKDTGGYYRVQLLGTRYVVHRIVWVLHNKQDLSYEFVINHIDSNTGNNHPSNLEKVTQQENSIKGKKTPRVKRFNNDSDGVSKSKQPNNLHRYVAVVTSPDNSKVSKSFSAKKYGDSEAYTMAVEWRISKIKEFYGVLINQNGEIINVIQGTGN